MSGNFIWGLLLVLLGLSIISKTLFGFAIPFIRITVALMIIYFGITLLLGAFGYKKPFCCPFTNQKIKITHFDHKNHTYSTVFSESTIDLTEVTLTEKPTIVELSTVFGTTKLLLNPAIATKIITNNVFANTKFSDDSEFSAIGDQAVLFGPRDAEPSLIIRANVVFGSLVIKKK